MGACLLRLCHHVEPLSARGVGIAPGCRRASAVDGGAGRGPCRVGQIILIHDLVNGAGGGGPAYRRCGGGHLD